MHWNDIFPPSFSMLVCWGLYAIFCLPAVALLWLALPYRYRFPPFLVISFFYLLSASLFIVGIMISLMLTLLLIALKRSPHRTHYASTSYPDYQKAPISENKIYGEGSGYKLITSHNFSKALRQKMLASMNQYNFSSVNQINEVALHDDIDEVRLYAQIFIEKQEREITRSVKYLNKKISEAKNEMIRAHYQKIMALNLWEQIYKNLFIQENLLPTLDKIKNLALNAFKFLPQDIEIPLLLSKIALRKGDLKEAKQWLEIASQNNAPDYKVLVYLAEIAYREGNFHEIPLILSKINSQGIIGLIPVLSFWVKHD